MVTEDDSIGEEPDEQRIDIPVEGDEPPEIIVWDNAYNHLNEDDEYKLADAFPLFAELEELIKQHIKRVPNRHTREKTLDSLEDQKHRIQSFIANEDDVSDEDNRMEIDQLLDKVRTVAIRLIKETQVPHDKAEQAAEKVLRIKKSLSISKPKHIPAEYDELYGTYLALMELVEGPLGKRDKKQTDYELTDAEVDMILETVILQPMRDLRVSGIEMRDLKLSTFFKGSSFYKMSITQLSKIHRALGYTSQFQIPLFLTKALHTKRFIDIYGGGRLTLEPTKVSKQRVPPKEYFPDPTDKDVKMDIVIGRLFPDQPIVGQIYSANEISKILRSYGISVHTRDKDLLAAASAFKKNSSANNWDNLYDMTKRIAKAHGTIIVGTFENTLQTILEGSTTDMLLSDWKDEIERSYSPEQAILFKKRLRDIKEGVGPKTKTLQKKVKNPYLPFSDEFIAEVDIVGQYVMPTYDWDVAEHQHTRGPDVIIERWRDVGINASFLKHNKNIQATRSLKHYDDTEFP